VHITAGYSGMLSSNLVHYSIKLTEYYQRLWLTVGGKTFLSAE